MKSQIQKICVLLLAFLTLAGQVVNAEDYQDSTIQDMVLLKDYRSYNKKLELVKNAKKRIWISVMAFDCSDSSQALFDELIYKQQ